LYSVCQDFPDVARSVGGSLMINPTPHVNVKWPDGSFRGAPMGRPAFGHGGNPIEPFILRRIRINSGGYDDGGAYWGLGAPLYWYCSYETVQVEHGNCLYCGTLAPFGYGRYGECNSPSGGHERAVKEDEHEVSDYIRADSRNHAKRIITAKYPGASFKR
jgi:hypothetical protein